MVTASDPAPAVIGMVRGKKAISALSTASRFSAPVTFGWAVSIPHAVKNTKMPPAISISGRETPKNLST